LLNLMVFFGLVAARQRIKGAVSADRAYSLIVY
jgi:hypothetical protein